MWIILIDYYQIPVEMQKSQRENKHINKRNLQSVTFFNYYLKSLFPRIFPSNDPRADMTCRATHSNITYNYLRRMGKQGVEASQNDALEAAKQVYFCGNISKMKENIFIRKITLKLPYLPLQKEIIEQISIFTTKLKYEQDNLKESLQSPRKGRQLMSSGIYRNQSHSITSAKKVTSSNNATPPEQFSLYVVHHNVNTEIEEELCWLNFIERYHFFKSEDEGEFHSSFTYQVVFSYNSEASILIFDQYSRFLQLLYEKNLYTGEIGTKNRMLVSQKFNIHLKKLAMASNASRTIQLQSPSFDPIHRRELQLSPTQLSLFKTLKPKAYAYFTSINKKRTPNPRFLQNIVCRMMSNKDYNENESWEAIQYYLDFQKRMRDKYRWTDFVEFDQMNIFSYIGKDMMGRPILLNRMRNTLCSKIKDFDKFLDYHLYLFEIYMQDQMEGWVDQFVVIVDASNQVPDNTNIGFTKRIITEAFVLLVGRPFRIIAFDMGLIGVLLYKVLRTLLPQSINECVRVLGDDRGELLEELRSIMTDDVIPEFIGGKNRTIDSKEEKEGEKLITDKTNDHSFVTPSSRRQ